MKTKNLIIVLSVLLCFLIYNMFFYHMINKSIDNGTKNMITDYLKNKCHNCQFNYEYLKATTNDDNTLNIFIKVDSKSLKQYYRFIIVKNGTLYQIIKVNNDIPAYIKY